MKTKNNKHTPGPWFSSDDERCIYAKITTVDGSYVTPLVAQCSKLTTSANANAALIAAAPEMLEMLETILNETDDAVWISKIESILNKAKGE